MAAEKGHLDIVEALLRKKADPNRFAALCYAAERGHLDVVKALVAGKANPSQRNSDFRSAIAFAIQNGFVDIAEFLFQKGGRFYSKGDLKQSKERGSRTGSEDDRRERYSASIRRRTRIQH